MSCGSTVCHSTNRLKATSPFFPGLRWILKIPLAALAGLALWLERRHQYRQLEELDDRLLADIGVSRDAAEEVRRSHLYLIAWRDSR